MSIKTHAQVISVFGLLACAIYGIGFLMIFAFRNGHGEYVWYTLGGIIVYTIFAPLYKIMYEIFESKQK